MKLIRFPKRRWNPSTIAQLTGIDDAYKVVTQGDFIGLFFDDEPNVLQRYKLEMSIAEARQLRDVLNQRLIIYEVNHPAVAA